MRKISVLGSTGSVGTQSLDVIEKLGLGVAALTANKSVDLLEKQARKFNPEIVGVYDEESAGILKKRLADTDIKVLSGMDGDVYKRQVFIFSTWEPKAVRRSFFVSSEDIFRGSIPRVLRSDLSK